MWAGSFQTRGLVVEEEGERRPKEESLRSRDGRREDLRLERLLERLLECLLPSDSGIRTTIVCWRRACGSTSGLSCKPDQLWRRLTEGTKSAEPPRRR